MQLQPQDGVLPAVFGEDPQNFTEPPQITERQVMAGCKRRKHGSDRR